MATLPLALTGPELGPTGGGGGAAGGAGTTGPSGWELGDAAPRPRLQLLCTEPPSWITRCRTPRHRWR
eukprot:5885833-Pyramimonas_sp.AAC.1